MKSWNGPEDDAASLVAPAPPRRAAGDGIRIRALLATFTTCAVLFGLDALFPDLKTGRPLARNKIWRTSVGSKVYEEPFEWSHNQVEPSENLEFRRCFDHFNGTHPGETVSIAITKLPARVPVDDPRYGGPILINPGGPGGPGALFTLMIGRSLQNIADSHEQVEVASSDAKYYDILGFDPRGIGETEPRAYCIADRAASWTWTLREASEGILGSSDAALGRLWSMTHAWGASCKQAVDAEEGPDIKQYMTTASVARDMLEIVEKHAAYVTRKVESLQPRQRGCRKPQAALIKPSEAKLQYWGFSYGTYLGSTFASMYPDRVGLAILDGVVSSYDYNHALGNGSLTDNAKAMNSFNTWCANAGEKVCCLATANSTADDIQVRVDTIVNSLYHNPIPLNSPNGPDILTYSDIKGLLFSSCYSPRAMFPLVAQILAEVEVGHGGIIDGWHSLPSLHCPKDGETPVTDYSSTVATYAILCSDGIDETNTTMDEFEQYWQLLEHMSPTAGGIWAMLRMRCLAWKIKAQYKFKGAFGGNTSHPILFISNTADPVTPLRSGRIMHELFPNSGLLTIDIAGHCSISDVNLCTLAHVKAYFQTGVLPKENTLCIPRQDPFSLNSTDPESPFYDPSLKDAKRENGLAGAGLHGLASGEEMELLMAGADLARMVAEHDLFGAGKISGLEQEWVLMYASQPPEAS
ncbi:TAP-like protein-domain-containing protein [Paraphoma chrysanthemicola]|uniref:TAP-like protein-domain-containing protein n=1 Tax=Paraphoma chrysanthemicola TaxID=798071 RepID=A0A8K0R7M8_9PLEO|nr:TAP-like protein-domain-containing protein [Paraphoma chrysanthemicola]